MFQVTTKTITLEDGRTITLETGKLAKQADGSVMLKMGNTMLLATVVSAKSQKEDVDFMPLSVEYKEKFASVGRFPGGFLKREGRPSDYEVLVSRIIDRALRPMFPNDYHAETFVVVTLYSADKDVMPDSLAGLAASAALMASDIPFNGPISEVRVSRINGDFVVNPSYTMNQGADIDLIVAGTIDNIVMVEGEMNEVSEAEMLEAIKVAHAAIKVQCKAQIEFAEAAGKSKKREYAAESNDEALKSTIYSQYKDTYYQIAKSGTDKHQRHEAFSKSVEEFVASITVGEEAPDAKKMFLINKYFHDLQKEVVRNMILNDRIRLDGRQTNQIRPITIEVDYLPATHGSALFTRGETQSLTTVTLGTKLDEQMLDGATIKGTEKFILHYNFPPFSTGDAKMSRGVGRREIGHGNLAHRALVKMVPDDFEQNPYTVRVVSDILESNGSSSMATVCAGTLALMDAGVSIKRPVSGIAMGLITDTQSGKFAVLSDILGDEDHLGDMDFKVTGTEKGITATQMDIKVEGLSYEILTQALEQARQGRLHILSKMTEVIASPRPDYKPHAPKIEKLTIPKDKIGAVIGQGGKVIQEMQAVTGTTIVIEEIDGCGVVEIFGPNKESIDQVKEMITGLITEPEVDTIYKGKVKTIAEYGAFVEILPGTTGLLHISELEWTRVQKVEDVLKEGDIVEVKLIEIERGGKLRLSRKVLLPKPEGYVEQPPRERRPDDRGGDRRDDRGRDRNRRDDRRR